MTVGSVTSTGITFGVGATLPVGIDVDGGEATDALGGAAMVGEGTGAYDQVETFPTLEHPAADKATSQASVMTLVIVRIA